MSTDFDSWARAHQQRFETVLENLLPQPDKMPEQLHQGMRYAVLQGGKRVRPLLVFATGELKQANQHRLNIAAAAVELIHAYSLVHDDMPSMDNDVLRRGKPTCHVEYGEATALLVGDSLQSLAFQLLSEHKLTEDAAQQLDMINVLALASGSLGMAGGQAIDLESVGQRLSLPQLEFMHIQKTGALIRAAVILGARCAGVTLAELEKLDHFSKCIGLAFQVVDDILDHSSDTATLGKTAGKDADNDKPTYVSLMGLQQAQQMAQRLHADALSMLDGFGDHAANLKALADFIVLRKS